MSSQTCPLCQTRDGEAYFEDSHRRYLKCRTCDLVFVPPVYYLSSDAEKQRYDLHQNSSSDPEYRRFLSRIFMPMQARLNPSSRGLDFGSGPGPTLSKMFEEAGHSMAIYDPYYAKDESVWEERYDFITASEVAEHLHQPRREFDRLWACLKPGGTLGVMTMLAPAREAFAAWHYKNDMTHVSFFSRSAFEWLGSQWGSKARFFEKDVVLLRKSE
ncbi:MAG: class I SAM-dependent methyltransferase [Proteobacteria bacterium]|nr:MAG: class I SAM-dependent methyltransferase [Pseudomonadota bacterium]TDJ75227.1 MAG: class I SAM-dependent methyltransferase [Pseudomonadota bacterium]